MAKKTEDLSIFQQREVLSYETWLTAPGSFRIVKNDRLNLIRTVSVYGCRRLKTDAVLVIGDNLRAAAEAAEFLHHHEKLHGCYPKVICSPGFNTPAAVQFSRPAELWLKLIMLHLGIPKSVLKSFALRFDRADPCRTLGELFEKHREFKSVIVFSSRGQSMTVAQELFQRIPFVEWVFFDNPFVQTEDRIFDAEVYGPDGYAVDMMLGNMSRVYQEWGVKRHELSPESRNNTPDKKLAREILLKGYVLGMERPADWAFFRADTETVQALLEERKSLLKTGDEAHIRVCGQVKRLIDQYSYLLNDSGL